MKNLFHLPLLVLSLALSSTLTAGTDAGDDSARNYKNFPGEYDGKRIDVDCTHVSRINGGPQIDEVTLFVAHTIDRDNRSRGGSIVVAVLAEDADKFARKFGTAVERNRQEAEKVDSKSLRGTFHMLDRGHVYIDYTDGEAHELVEAKLDLYKTKIASGSAAGRAGKKIKRF
ncbi:MAG: hypothetical protein AAGC73_04100 [Verrucomicrobiota bacterium]